MFTSGVGYGFFFLFYLLSSFHFSSPQNLKENFVRIPRRKLVGETSPYFSFLKKKST